MPDEHSLMLAVFLKDVKFNFIFEHFEGEVFDVFIQIIPSFYSSKANVEITTRKGINCGCTLLTQETLA